MFLRSSTAEIIPVSLVKFDLQMLTMQKITKNCGSSDFDIHEQLAWLDCYKDLQMWSRPRNKKDKWVEFSKRLAAEYGVYRTNKQCCQEVRKFIFSEIT